MRLYMMNCKKKLLVIFSCLSYFIQSEKISFARTAVNDSDQSRCFKNLLLKLSNDSFTASSVWKNGVEFEPYQARVLRIADTNTNLAGQAWCPKQLIKSLPEEWIEIDFKELKLIINLFTIGRGDGNFEEFAPFFYLDYQRVSDYWYRYKNQDNRQLLVGNSDSRNVARTRFESPIVAKKIRIYPISKRIPRRACMKIGIYGCDFNDGIIEYSVAQGHALTLDEKEKYDLRDLTYDGVNIVDRNSKILLDKGLGQLTDNIIYHDVVYNDRENKIQGYHFVGWNRKLLTSNKVEIIFKFDQIRAIKQIKFYTLNMISNGIGYFSSAVIHFSIGGEIYDSIYPASYYNTVANREVYRSQWVEISIKSILTRYMKIDLFFELDWIIISEIIVTSEKSNVYIPKEINYFQSSTSNIYNFSTVKKSYDGLTISPYIQTQKKVKILERNKYSFFTYSNIGLIATIASSFLGSVFLIALITAGVMSIRRRSKHSTDKLKYPFYQSKMNDIPVVVPLTGSTDDSTGIGKIYYKQPGSLELGLTYPVMSKEYMSLSSKSGNDYDMTGGNSLDGLIPAANKEYKYNGSAPHALQISHRDSPYLHNIYCGNSADGSIGGSSNTDYASTPLHSFSPVFESGSNFYNYNQQGIGSPFKVPNTAAAQILVQQGIDKISQYSHRPILNLNHLNSMHSSSSRLLMSSNVDFHPIHYIVQCTNFPIDTSTFLTSQIPLLKGIFGNSVMTSTNHTFYVQPNASFSLKPILNLLKEIHQDQIEHISVIAKEENGSIGFITISKNQNSSNHSKTYLYKSINDYKWNEIKYETAKEIDLLLSIKHPAFLVLTAYLLDQPSSVIIKQSNLCFLFEVNENLENLHTFLQHHTANNNEALPHPRKSFLYSQSISNISKSAPLEIRHQYPSVSSLVFIISQIASGMSYLERNQIVHRDLAARNCLIDMKMIIKITDIAISIQKFKEHYNECSVIDIRKNDDNENTYSMTIVKRLYPFQWMSWETILEASYSTKTDIWSFGVTMWEILTRCQLSPYGCLGISLDRIKENAHHLSTGSSAAIFPSGNLCLQQSTLGNLQNTINNSDSLKNNNLVLGRDFTDLINECWQKDPQERPSFQILYDFFEKKIRNYQMNLDESSYFSNSANSEFY